MKDLTLREIQLAELNILIEFDRICQTEKLRYSLAGGTLLGAVRHKGFIPWDDDIDVCMPRPDYEKFKSIFKSEKFYLSDDRGKNAKYPFLKMMDRSVEVVEDGFDEVPNLWIDIFPIDGFPSDDNKVEKFVKKASFYRKIISFDNLRDFKSYKGKHNKIFAFFLKIFTRLYGVRRAVEKSDRLAEKYKYEDSDFVGAVTWGCYGVGERLVKSEYENFVGIEFEGIKFMSMGCWNSYLHAIYGDYMTLPPEDKREVHGIKAKKV